MSDWGGPICFVKEGGKTPEEIGSTISGVYIIGEQTDDGPNALYVGRAKNISKRIKEHCSDADNDRCCDDGINERLCRFIQKEQYGTMRYWFLKVAGENERKKHEYTLYDHYGGEDELYNEWIEETDIVDMEFPFRI